MSKRSVPAGDVAALLARFSKLKRKAAERTGNSFPIVVIQEAGLDGFWLHRVLQSEGVESRVVDPASIATSRRRRRAKTDKIDGEALLRALLGYQRGEPRVCAMVKAPTPDEEDRRRVGRERKVLITERVKHVNRVKGLLFSQGICGYEPLRRDRRQRLDELTRCDGRPVPVHLKTQISRELDRLELLLDQIKLSARRLAIGPCNRSSRQSKSPPPTARDDPSRDRKPAERRVCALRAKTNSSSCLPSLPSQGSEPPANSGRFKPPSLSLAGVWFVISDHAMGLPVLRTLSLCTCCRHYPGAATGRRLCSSHPAVTAFPQNVVGSACTTSFSRLARRSLALRPAHSRSHLYVTSYAAGFGHFVTSMTAPVASGWSVRRVGLAPTGKRRPLTAHT